MIYFKKVAIIGVGLLGGSLGLALKKKKMAGEVVGFFRDKNKIGAAVRRGVIDKGTDNFSDAVGQSDFIVLCSPVEDIIRRLYVLKKIAGRRTFITDTGSTKSAIVRAAAGLNFIGSHPLAGSQQSGIDYARADLFKNSVCILTPDKNSPVESLKILTGFWEQCGARVVTMTASAHDRALGFSSHLPHAAAFALINAIPAKSFEYCAGGLKDTTRIALSNPQIWADIFLSNRRCILKSLVAFQRSLCGLREMIDLGQRRRLLSFLNSAREKRRRIG